MRILFVCHGSICRSPAAEMIFKSLNNEHEVFSRALTTEEIGNDIYPPMKKELAKRGIPFTPHQARLISLDDYESSDYIFYMDVENHYMLTRRFGESKKILPVFQFSKDIREIEDPWWTGNYKKVVDQLTVCIKDIIENIN